MRWILVVVVLALAVPAMADEGMFLLTDPPRRMLKERYAFDLTDAWLQQAMGASVRFNNGGSGGFVSPEGLVVTNHHIAADTLAKLSTEGRDLLATGFLARTRAEELKAPDLELNVLQSIQDVTARVKAAVKPGMTPAQAAAARRAEMAVIEKESLDRTGLRSDVVTLYAGGLYHLYRSKKYTDVRVVWAPEGNIASFGGDVDNFEYPRRSLDVALFRVYDEDGRPVRPPHWFRWDPAGPRQGDLVFVVGHPGRTNRLETVARLEHLRDRTLPYRLARVRSAEAALTQFSAQGPEEARRASQPLHSVANSRKAYSGMYQGLLQRLVMDRRRGEEANLRAQVPDDSAWEAVARAQETLGSFEEEWSLLEGGDAFDSRLFEVARHLVRLEDELPKPSPDRLREYRDSNLESLRLELFSPAPLYPDLERVQLTASLSLLAERLGGDHPTVRQVLLGLSPEARAAQLVAGTKLFDVAERRRFSADDPMIALARAVDPRARELRKRYETEVEEPERQAYGRIAEARFAVEGTSRPPDATFTLRLAFGVVKGYEDVPWRTTMADPFAVSERLGGREPFDLPASWREARPRLDLDTTMDFVSTADTIGGNSGSPVLNRDGRVVGVNFDRNRFGLVRNFVYDETRSRHISVSSAAVLEALRGVYGADALVEELTAP